MCACGLCAPEVSLAQEDDDDGRLPDVLLELTDIVQIIDVEKNLTKEFKRET
jgi:hypothetical protein